jgi:hypothetical protein
MNARRADAIKTGVAVGGSFLLVVALVTFGWMLVRPDPAPGRPTSADAPPTGATPTASPTSAPSATLTRTVRPTPSKTKRPTTTRPRPTRRPPAKDLPPPPPSPRPGCTPRYSGPKAPFPDVREALVAAATTEYWQGVQPPAELEGPLPTITVPVNLIKAVAWQESGWQSTIIACDGGVGTLQVMPGTAEFVNNRFGTNFSINTLSGNTSLGAAYLEWLTMYFGLYYFGSFDLAATAPVGTDGAQLRLRDVVVSAYNVGPHALERDHGTPEPSDDTVVIPNRSYVNNVTALITECVCLDY